VYAKEGPIAHFHVVDTKTKKEGCVKIEKAEYFPRKEDTHIQQRTEETASEIPQDSLTLS
jgi:hypothetical protein